MGHCIVAKVDWDIVMVKENELENTDNIMIGQ